MSSSRKKFVIYFGDELLSQNLEKFKTEDSKLYQRILEAIRLFVTFLQRQKLKKKLAN